MENCQINVIASLQVAGVHSWPSCPYPEVSYLRLLHRHVFHIKAKKKVTHTDRDVEIIKLKNEIADFFKRQFQPFKLGISDLNFGSMSCEDIALLLCTSFNLESCEVLEDGENGAEVIVFETLPI